MISVGSRDGRKRIEVGFGAGREMEETELEEGEAFSYQEHDDSTIDPDVALSYIDEKIQDVLGHFQKDFEGGVSAENLGSKFGGYGSFLPTYPRSPVLSQPRTPPEAHSYSAPKPSTHPLLESGSPSVRPIAASTSAASVSARSSSASKLVKRNAGQPFINSEEHTSRCGFEKNPTNSSDQNPFKVRIKVGAESLPTRRNAEIHSRLGLDISPWSSLDESSPDSEGLPCDVQDSQNLSPSSILEIMTSFSTHGYLLLSPLSDELIRLAEKGEALQENEPKCTINSRLQVSEKSVQKSNSGRDDLEEKKLKPSRNGAFPVKITYDNGSVTQNEFDARLKKESDADTLACEKLVSNALKLPLLSESYEANPGKASTRSLDVSRIDVKDSVKDETLSRRIEKDVVEIAPDHQLDRVDKVNRKNSFKKDRDDKNANYANDWSDNPKKDGKSKSETSDMSASKLNKVRKALDVEDADPPKQPLDQKGTSVSEDGKKLTSGKEHNKLSSGGKRKSKSSQERKEVSNESSMAHSSLAPKSRKAFHAGGVMPKSDEKDFLKEQKNAGDIYKDLFGSLDLEHEEVQEMNSKERVKDSDLVGKRIVVERNMSTEGSNSKKIEKPSASRDFPRIVPNVAPPTGNVPNSDAPSAPAPPLVQEDWVCCDKCQKWRLLPLGMNPESLPEKWLCSMLNWMPGMNQCSISEEETTNTLRSLYQVSAPAPANQQLNHHGFPSGTQGVPSGTGWYSGHDNDHRQGTVPSGKKKHGSKEKPNLASRDGVSQLKSPPRRNHHATSKGGRSSGGNRSPVNGHSQQFGQSDENQRHKLTEKKNTLHSYSGADTKTPKTKNKRETDIDGSRAFKRAKTEDMHDDDENCTYNRFGTKVGQRSASDLSNSLSEKGSHKRNKRSKDSKGNDNKNSVFAGNPETDIRSTLNGDPQHMSKYSNKGSLKRRKGNEYDDSQVNKMCAPEIGYHPLDNRVFMEETPEKDHRKDKKAKTSKLDGKDGYGNNISLKYNEKGRKMKDNPSRCDLESIRQSIAADSLKKDSGSMQRSLAATSSSSKVSGSHKFKSTTQEVKGSPVESVSSSPLRISNTDKGTSIRMDDQFFAAACPKKSPDSEDEANHRRMIKDKTFDATHQGSHESSVLDFQDDDMGQVLGTNVKVETLLSSTFANGGLADVPAESIGKSNQYDYLPKVPERGQGEERKKDSLYSGSHSKKNKKGSSARPKDHNTDSRPEFEKGVIRGPDFLDESLEHSLPYDEKFKDGGNKSLGMSGGDSNKVTKYINSDGEPSGALLNDKCMEETRSKFGGSNGSHAKGDIISNQPKKQNEVLDRNTERSSKKLPFDNSGRGKPEPLSAKGQNEGFPHRESLSEAQKESGANSLVVHALENDDTVKGLNQSKKVENQNGNQHNQPNCLHRSTPNAHRTRDVNAPSPVRKDSSSQAATNALKEAKDLKHMADRLKASGSIERTGIYFQAALKFLHGAFLLESCNSDSSKYEEIYSSTAKLCEFCAREYEKSKDLAAAALAYKCMEVAYMRVICSLNNSASRDRSELQKALQIVPPGESPSSSASDFDNFNNLATTDKIPSAKGLESPQVAGTRVITARNRSSFMRLLDFARDVNAAMEASRKSRVAFAAASQRLEGGQNKDILISVKRALDFNFHDVDGLLRLIRVATEAISR